MKRVLIISPYFPPSTVAGVHRARILANNLKSYQWEPIVICVNEKFHEQKLDRTLAELVDSSVKVVKVNAWPTKLSRALGIGDLSIRGFSGIKSAIDSIMKNEGADLLFVSVLPGFSMRLGSWAKKKYNLKFVLDYQDPWLEDGFQRHRFPSKLWFSFLMARLIEPTVIRDAAFISSVSDGTNELVRSRYPALSKNKFYSIPIGCEKSDFDYLRKHSRKYDYGDKCGFITISYVGNVWDRGQGTLSKIFNAVKVLRNKWEQNQIKVRFLFIGSSNQPIDSVTDVAMPLAEEVGVEDMVIEKPCRVSYLEALNILVNSDINLAFGSDEPHYSASKIYPLLLAEKPVFSVFHRRSNVCDIANEVGGMRIVKFNTLSDAGLDKDIANGLNDMIMNYQKIEKPNLKELEKYLGSSVGKQFAQIFSQTID